MAKTAETRPMDALRISAAGLGAGLWLSACVATPATTPAFAPHLVWPATLAVAPEAPSFSERIAPPFEGLRTTDGVVELIKSEEGLRLEAYSGPGGWLIGYGHQADDVTADMRITEAQADEILRADLAVIETEIKRLIAVPVNADEFSAVVGLAYNIGPGAFAESTLLEELNAGDRNAAADAFLSWNKITLNGVRMASAVLAERRRFERNMFLGRPAEAEG